MRNCRRPVGTIRMVGLVDTLRKGVGAVAPGRGLRIARLQGEPDRPLMGRCESIDRSPTVMIPAHRAFLFISIRPPGPAAATAA